MTTTIAMTSPDHTLMLRTCDAQMRSYGGFVWPRDGLVECPGWDPTPECGNGLHGFLRGCGDGGLASWGEDAVWLVVEIFASDVVNLNGKVKVPRGRVLHAGKRKDALALMRSLGHLDDGHIGGTATAGDGGTATAGYRGTATAGDGGTATAGYGGTATAGDGGTASAGDGGTATAGDGGTATAGYRGTASAGDRGTATADYGGTATAGYGGTASAGDGGTIIIAWWDTKSNRMRKAVGYIGEDGLEPGKKYMLQDAKFVEVK